MSDYGSGWTAILVDSCWLVLEPVDEGGDPRPSEIGADELLCIVTSDNPEGKTRGHGENGIDRWELWNWATTRASFALTAGGAGSTNVHPAQWPELELGVMVPVESIEEGIGICEMFKQAAVYILRGNTRLLVDARGVQVREQCYYVHRASSA